MAWRGLRIESVVEAGIETAARRAMISPRVRMKKLGSFFVAGFSAVALCSSALAQSDDPSESFLKAYMTAQQGEKLEHDGDFNAALAKYRFAGSLLEQLRKTHGDWQPAIVDYRGRKVSEAILRVQGKASTQQDLNIGPTPLPGGAPVLPEQTGSPDATIEIPQTQPNEPTAAPAGRRETRKPAATPAPTPDEAAIKEATRKLQTRIDQLEAELQKSRDKFTDAEKEKAALNTKLKDASAKLQQAQSEVQKGRDAEKKLHDQLVDAHQSLKKVEAATGTDSKAQEALRAEIDQLNKNLAAIEKGRSAAEKERDEANARVTAADRRTASAMKQRDDAVASANKQRDEALAQLAGLKDAQQRVDTLVAQNSDLKKKLADAEKSVRQLSDDKPKKEQELAEVKRQVEDLRQKLAASQKQNQDYQGHVSDLNKQLEEAGKQIEEARVVGATPEETARLTKENQILRNIVVRERQEEARRDQAKKLMLAEFDKLKIKSDTLTEQIELLAQPVTKLSDEELALLRQPIVSISDNNPNALQASFTFAKKTENGSAPGATDSTPPAPASETGDKKANSPPNNFHPNVPEDLVGMAHDAKDNFDKGKYHSAERLYQEILTKSPNNLYSLSNLGVVYFRTGKLKAAELTLKKAITLAPKDEFSHTTLGIVYYRQAKFDEALTELTRALAINPKSATAHNYLGITASQKGWQEAAEKEMLQAIEDNPDYADAHFNLAVIYATANPPAKELAKRHYTRATSLGAQPDPSLERLLR
jgi:Flp pilus assembly protein TadD/predicted  nucleic acid-binding Zn-ribbon protein